MGLASESTVRARTDRDDEWESVYVGEAVRLFVREPPDAEHVCFTFDSLNQPAAPPQIPAADLLWQHGAAHAHLSTANDWYQNTDFKDALAAMRDIRKRFARASTYGGSMGGYAALLFSGLLSTDKALALGPQFSIDPMKAPFETRWHALAQSLSFANDTMAASLKQPCRRIVFYDPACYLDKLHVDLIQAHGPVELRTLPFCGHYPLQVLSGHVTNFVREALLEDARPSVIAPLRRQGRRSSSRYYNELAVWFAARGNEAASFRCLSSAYLADPASTSVIETTFQVMQNQPAYTRILQHMLLRLIRHEQPTWTQYDQTERQLLSALQQNDAPMSRNT